MNMARLCHSRLDRRWLHYIFGRKSGVVTLHFRKEETFWTWLINWKKKKVRHTPLQRSPKVYKDYFCQQAGDCMHTHLCGWSQSKRTWNRQFFLCGLGRMVIPWLKTGGVFIKIRFGHRFTDRPKCALWSKFWWVYARPSQGSWSTFVAWRC